MNRTGFTSIPHFCVVVILLVVSAVFSPKVAAQVETDAQGFEVFEHHSGDTTYTMKKYYLCLLKSGDNRSQNEEEAIKIQKDHLAHLQSLADQKKICISGPLAAPESDIRGIVVYSVTSLEEAKELASADPAVQAGRLEVEILPWWAAKGAKLF